MLHSKRMRQTRRRAYTNCRGTRKRIALASGIELTRSKADLYASGVLQKKGWVHVSDGYIYVARDVGRSYWVLKRMDPTKRPVISFNDKMRTIRIGGNRIVVHGCTDYQRAKAMLEPWGAV